jgi:hypothetical protein
MNHDALVYGTFSNNITSNALLNEMASATNPPSSSTLQLNTYFNSLLTDTNIKRAVCMNKHGLGDDKGINVRIPVPSNYDMKNESDLLRKKFGYIDKLVKVPVSVASKYSDHTQGSQKCDYFMKVYCENQKMLYKQQNNGLFNQSEWKKYKPECACYGDINSQLGFNVAPYCYMDGCNNGSQNVYLDPVSRQASFVSGTCPTTICSANINIDNATAGRDVNTNAQFNQTCGTNSNTNSTQGAGAGSATNTTTQNNTSGNNTSGNNTTGNNTTGNNTSGNNTSGNNTSGNNTIEENESSPNENVDQDIKQSPDEKEEQPVLQQTLDNVFGPNVEGEEPSPSRKIVEEIFSYFGGGTTNINVNNNSENSLVTQGEQTIIVENAQQKKNNSLTIFIFFCICIMICSACACIITLISMAINNSNQQ